MSKRLLDIVKPSTELQEKLMMVRTYYWVEEHIDKNNEPLEFEDIVSFMMFYTHNEKRSIYLAKKFDEYWEKNFKYCCVCDKLCVDEPICNCPNNGECKGVCKDE